MTLEEALKRLEWKAQDLKKFSDDGRYMGLRSELSSGTCYELGVEILQEITAIKEALAQPEQEPHGLAAYVIGCFSAAEAEGLQEALAETTDERLKDLVERRLMYALYEAQKPQPKEPEQEPVTWIDKFGNTTFNKERGMTPLYTTPPQRKPLTDEQILSVARDHYNPHQRPEISFARAIEAAHGIK